MPEPRSEPDPAVPERSHASPSPSAPGLDFELGEAAQPSELRRHTRWLWWLATWCALALAALGVLLPGLPTVPFVLVAAFCASRGSPRMRRWLETHARFGPMIRDWEREGAVSRRAKRLALSMMLLCSALLAWVASMLGWLLASLCMAVVAIWLWRRPEPMQGPLPEAGVELEPAHRTHADVECAAEPESKASPDAPSDRHA